MWHTSCKCIKIEDVYIIICQLHYLIYRFW